MKNILFTALLGCLVASGIAQHDNFQFTDSQGRCWTCAPGQPCRPCGQSQIIDPFLPPLTLDPSCPLPDCTDPAQREFLHPIAGNPLEFMQCAPSGNTFAPVRILCLCGYFEYVRQSCQTIYDWQPFCDITGPLPDPIGCETATIAPTTIVPTTIVPTTIVPTTEVLTTPAPPAPPCNPCQPCMPCMIWWMCQPCNQQCNNGCMG